MDNFDYHLDHFGCDCLECQQRDNFSGAAIGAAAGSVIPGLGTALGGTIGGLADIFGGGTPEDTSDKGYQAYAASGQAPAYYPPPSLLREIMPSMGLSKYVPLLSSYDQTNGTFREGDWIIKVTSNSPITLRWFKGATEGASFSSSKTYVPTVAQAVKAVQTGAVNLADNASQKTGISLSSNTLLYIGLGLIALVGVYFIAKK